MRVESEVRDLADQAFAELQSGVIKDAEDIAWQEGVWDALTWAKGQSDNPSEDFAALLDRMRRAQADEAAAAGEPVDIDAVVIVSRADLKLLLNGPATKGSPAAQRLREAL
jgi:hypothetical protein